MTRHVYIPGYTHATTCSEGYLDDYDTEMIMFDLASISSARIVNIKTRDVEWRGFWREAAEVRMQNGDVLILDCSLGHLGKLVGAETAIEKE